MPSKVLFDQHVFLLWPWPGTFSSQNRISSS